MVVSANFLIAYYFDSTLFGLAELLKDGGSRIDMVLGASSAGKIYAPLEGKRAVNSMTITTDDGSAGTKGQVVTVLPGLIESSQTTMFTWNMN